MPMPQQPSLKKAIMQARGWDSVMREVMLASRTLQILPAHERTEHTLIAGCESQVWLDTGIQEGKVVLRGYSPSKVVRGLLAVMFEPLEGQPVTQVVAFDMTAYLAQLGLARHLTPSRGNGLAAVMTAIKASLQRFK